MSINFLLSHSALKIRHEKKYDTSLTLGALKEKLVAFVGTPTEHMRLEQHNDEAKVLRVLQGDERPLSSFGLPDTVYLHIVDTDPQQRALAYTDVSKVKKYEMSDEDYGKRKDSVRAWKAAEAKKKAAADAAKKEADAKAAAAAAPTAAAAGGAAVAPAAGAGAAADGKSADAPAAGAGGASGAAPAAGAAGAAAAAAPAGPSAAEKEATAAAAMKVGDRCELASGARGSVAFVGPVPELDTAAVAASAIGGGAVWVGVKLDEPVGSCDGTAKGKRYFAAKAKFGTFVRPTALKVGDYPEEDIDEEL